MKVTPRKGGKPKPKTSQKPAKGLSKAMADEQKKNKKNKPF